MIIFLSFENTFWMPFFIVMLTFGIEGNYVCVFLATVDVFPVLFASTAMGFCNFFGKLLAIGCPIVAEATPPLPIIVVICLIGTAIVLI